MRPRETDNTNQMMAISKLPRLDKTKGKKCDLELVRRSSVITVTE